MSKKLYRSKSEKMIAGVGAGIADYFKIDPTIVRVLLVLIGLSMPEVFLVGYIVAAIIVPERPEGLVDEEDDEVEVVDEDGKSVKKEHNNRQVLGLIFVGAGAIMLFSRVVTWFDSSMMLAVAIIAVGAYVLIKRD